MSERTSAPPANLAGLALLITLAVQTLAALAQGIPTVLAPAVAPQLGFAPERIGWFVGLVYLVAMLSGLAGSGYVRRLGALFFCQLVVLFGGAGLVLLAAGVLPALIAAAILIGSAYGLANPSSADMLGRYAPPNRRGLYFSLKQIGVPAGVALAGLIGPWLYLRVGWHSTVVIVGTVMLLSAALLQPMARHFDRDLARGARTPGLTVIAPLQAVLHSVRLRRLALVSVFYAMTQLCLLTFLVSYLHLSHGLSLSVSAAVLATAQLASMAGRPLWGHLADLWGHPARLLGLMGIGMGATCWALAALPAQPALWWVYGVCIACAATAIAWNGVFYAELVRAAPHDQLATITGATQFLTFLGAMIGPVLFSQVVSWRGGDYGFAYGLLAVLPVVAGVSMLLAEARSGVQPAPG